MKVGGRKKKKKMLCLGKNQGGFGGVGGFGIVGYSVLELRVFFKLSDKFRRAI